MTTLKEILETICEHHGYSYTGYRRHHGMMVHTAVYRTPAGSPRVITAMSHHLLVAVMNAAPRTHTNVEINIDPEVHHQVGC